MVDQMVLRAQQWVNATYASVPGYEKCDENGHTGWETMFCLTRALQHELGITALSDNFGPTTLARLTAYGTVGPASGNLNLRKIVEAALYCKGYVGGQIDGAFGAPTQAGLTSLLANMGVPAPAFPAPWGVAPKVFKALLTMDAYVVTPGGDATVRDCQRWLNGAYYARAGFFIGPCDGHYSRSVQIALVLAIQYRLGMGDDEVTGYIGPGTRSGLRNRAPLGQGSTDAGWIRLFKCAVQFNGRDCDWANADSYTDALAGQVRAFQEFSKLPATGKGDYQTWMSLLVSTGDPDRIGTAFDCMYPLNNTTIATVKSHGYRIVGRYLTGGSNKRLTSSEIALIADNGLSFFPIYQEDGNAPEYFDYWQGHAAGAAACAAAHDLGIPYGTVLYVAVDFDALDEEITSNVIPHFEGVRDAVMEDGSRYAVGVYGCRNTCIRLSREGLTTRSFVSGMSTGYSGNLGFPLPSNWAFDQIANRVLDEGSAGAVEIDNDIVSGRDLGITSVTRPRDPNDGFSTLLVWLEARAGQWRDQGHTDRSAPELVAQCLRTRTGNYSGSADDVVFGPLDRGFLGFVAGYAGRPDDSPLRDPLYLWDSDVDHFGASFGSVLNYHRADAPDDMSVADFGTWAGDLLTVLGDFVDTGRDATEAYDYAINKITNRSAATSFSLGDFIADVDAWVLGLDHLQNPSVPLSRRVAAAYASPAAAGQRHAAFFTRRFNGSTARATAVAKNFFGSCDDDLTRLVRDTFWAKDHLTRPHLTLVAEAARDGVSRAFADVVTQNAA